MANFASTTQGGDAIAADDASSSRKHAARTSAKPSSRSSSGAGSTRRRNRPGPRQRLLESATRLFTTEGIRVIGIDRILRDADVAKASLYSLFGSKDNLVVAYIEELDQDWRRRWEEMCADRPKPEDRILAFFDMAIADEPKENFRGSHFQNAASEYPRPETDSEHRIRQAALAHRSWCRDTMADLLTEKFGYASRTLADQLIVFLDGGIAGSKMSRTVSPLETSRELAKQLLYTAPMMYTI
ncbi:TetR/AcrR family transcriptional regulator [Corynebacterium terpenotabidum]|uniref:TetR family transcriptional regulator n=1 Tax=Corynebacterium terpenotabidum Y-11 TaxID=1200352 RepID=S4XDZ2_9CORY|nr:TetR/AcrR family transcriptional regulator [Corynebacterium terpenotabidum]AGP29815.1 TetR family transcriptional regulator [Corynebacterium terpenotabidum Y-11]